jgi:hypothetical protein
MFEMAKVDTKPNVGIVLCSRRLGSEVNGAKRAKLATISSILPGWCNAGGPIPDVTFLRQFCVASGVGGGFAGNRA